MIPEPEKSNRMLDLHTHSTASDGTLTPAEMVRQAVAAGLTAVALTDHDTLAGLTEFMAAGANAAVETVPGVEIACSWYGRSLHLVGLFVQADNQPLRRLLEKVRDHREKRNLAMLAKLADAGLPLTYDEVRRTAGGKVIGRPHFAAALVARGYCRTAEEAFARYIGRGAAAYVRRYLPLPTEALKALHDAGGVAVWAHPCGGSQDCTLSRLRQIGRHLRKHGLDGIEAFYSDHSRPQQEMLLQLAAELQLLPSGGSDFHGDNMPGVSLGYGRDRNLDVPDAWLSALRRRSHDRSARLPLNDGGDDG